MSTELVHTLVWTDAEYMRAEERLLALRQLAEDAEESTRKVEARLVKVMIEDVLDHLERGHRSAA
jgi:hypothetical protein